MRCDTKQYKAYCSIEQHARSMYLGVLSQHGEVLRHRTLTPRPEMCLKALVPYHEDLVVCVACIVPGLARRPLGPPRDSFCPAEHLDAWFARTAQKPYTRTVLFSTVSDILSQVVCRIKPSVRAAYRDHADQVGASRTSLSNTRNGGETRTLAEMVRSSALSRWNGTIWPLRSYLKGDVMAISYGVDLRDTARAA